MSSPLLPPKKDVALALLERASLYVHLDPRAESVVVPQWLRNQPRLVLQIGLNMAIPIPDLRVDEGGLACTLSFNRAPFYCMVPWSSVFAMVGEDGRGMVWPDDVPREIAAAAQAEEAKPKLRVAPPPPESAPQVAAPARRKSAKAKDVAAAEGKPAPDAKREADAAPAKKSAGAKKGAAKAEPKERAKKPARAPKKDAVAADAPRQPDLFAEAAKSEAPAELRVGKAKRPLPPYLRVVK